MLPTSDKVSDGRDLRQGGEDGVWKRHAGIGGGKKAKVGKRSVGRLGVAMAGKWDNRTAVLLSRDPPRLVSLYFIVSERNTRDVRMCRERTDRKMKLKDSP